MGIVFRSFQHPFHPIVHKMYLSGNIGISKYEVSQDTIINVINIEFKINLLIKVFIFSMKKSSHKQRNLKWGRRTKFAVRSLHRVFTFLHDRIFYASIYDFQIKNYYIADTLYFLKIFGKIDIVDNQLSVNFIVRYCESINVLCKDNTFWFPTSNRYKKGPYLTFWQYTFNERSEDFFDNST